MRSFAFCLLFLFSFAGSLYSQFPQEQWSNSYGNISSSSQPTLLPLPTSDGGFLILSCEYAAQNNPAPRGDADLVLTKTNSEGFVQWKKVYGGSGNDFSPSINFMKANDGGFLITGNSFSVDGDLPSNNDPLKGNLWVLKIDENGNIIFSKIIKSDFDTYEYIQSIIPLNDSSGYLAVLLLYDNAPGTHPNGLFTNCTGGSTSYKLVKLNNTGNVTFQKCFVTDNGNIYRGFSITNGPTNKYLISSNGLIPSNCNVTQPAFLGMINDTLFYFWKKTVDLFGLPGTHYTAGFPKFDVLRKGNNFIFPLRDGSSCNYPHSLVVMCLDTLGNLVWKNTFPDHNFNNFVTPVDAGDSVSFFMMQNPVGIGSFPDSSIIYKFSFDGTLLAKKILDKFQGNEMLLDFRQAELFKVGNQFYFGGTNTGHNYYPMQFSTYTKPIFGKLGPVNSVTGYAFLDRDSNQIKDPGEVVIPGIKVTGLKTNGHFFLNITDSGGRYQMLTDTGFYTYSLFMEGINNFNIFPALATTNHSVYLVTDTINFALTAIPGNNDFSVKLVPATPVVPGNIARYKLICRNNGGASLNARLKFIKLPSMILTSSSKPYTSLVADTITWNYTNLATLTNGIIDLSFSIATPPIVKMILLV